jgi:hypothetical protein
MKFTPVLLIGTCLSAVAAGQAQTTAGPQDPLTPIRSNDPLTAEDRTNIQTFVEQRVRDIASGEALIRRPALQGLRAGYAGPDGFKEAYARASVNAARNAVRRADLVPATQILAVLGSFRTLQARELFIEMLGDERVGVRAAAALGLRVLRQPIANAGGDTYSNTLQALRSAGEAEKSRDTLRAIYAAMDYPALETPPPLAPAATQLLQLLEARAGQYRAGSDVPAVGADDAGLLLANRLLDNYDADAQNRLARAAARMVKYAIEQYRSPSKKLTELRDDEDSRQLLAYRNAMERLVLAGEIVLKSILKPEVAPQVMDKMGDLDTTGMKLQWQTWNALLKQRVNQDFALEEEAAPAGDAPAP